MLTGEKVYHSDPAQHLTAFQSGLLGVVDTCGSLLLCLPRLFLASLGFHLDVHTSASGHSSLETSLPVDVGPCPDPWPTSP